MEISTQGAHQLELRRRSVKILLGAMKVFKMRAPSERGTGSGFGEIGAGGIGAAAMVPPQGNSGGLYCGRGLGHKRRSADDDRNRQVTPADKRRHCKQRLYRPP